MFRPEERLFAFTRKRHGHDALCLEGQSLRYSAMAVLGAMHLDEQSQRRIFGGETAGEYCGRLIYRLTKPRSLGDIALVAWAAAATGHPAAGLACEQLHLASERHAHCFTVEAAWALTAIVAGRDWFESRNAREEARDRLLRAFSYTSGIFLHSTLADCAPWYRSHVSCFADQVYPIQALARSYSVFKDEADLAAAVRCAEQVCRLQGDCGQWWWHYDARTGKVVEGYPVYSVHQDAMAPMALMELFDAGGPDFAEEIGLGMLWLKRAPEVRRSLIDENRSMIWRKVARAEPCKLVRGVRSTASRFHPDLHLSVLDSIFPARAIDYESRPYHLGWVLYTWLGGGA